MSTQSLRSSVKDIKENFEKKKLAVVNIKSDQNKLDHKHKMNKWIIIRFQ